MARTVFRFAFAYWLLYSFELFAGFPVSLITTIHNRFVTIDPANPPGWLEYVGYASKPAEWYSDGMVWYTVWSCRTFLGVDTANPTDMSGSGDRQFAYCTAFAYLTLAIAIFVLWTIASELWMRLRTLRRPSYDRLNALFRLVVRFYLMYFMLVYGAIKIWCGQFPPISDFQLETKYGDSSPMGLLWRFMQFSQPYTSATDFIETTCGLLLVCRRTTLLGALCSFGSMGQVFLLNMCYDVPVKLFSGHLLLMAVTLIVPDWRKLTRFFVLAKSVDPRPLPALFVKWVWCHRIGLVLRTLLYLTFAGFTLEQEYTAAKRRDMPSTPMPYVGRWVGVEFERDGVKVPFPEQPENPVPVPFKPSHWVGGPAGARYLHTADTNPDGELVLTTPQAPEPVARLRMSFPEPNRLVLEGPVGSQRVRITLRRIVEGKKEYPLRTKKFNWIQEYPDNR